MAGRLIWSAEALDDIDAIASYIARDSLHHAKRVVEQIFSVAGSIAEHPEAGRVVPELQDSRLRERFVFSYRIVHEIDGDVIAVIAVIHGKRLLESIEQRFG